MSGLLWMHAPRTPRSKLVDLLGRPISASRDTPASSAYVSVRASRNSLVQACQREAKTAAPR